MCGISGFNFGDEKLIKQMNDVVSHRGPDQDSFWVDDNISLGHARLSIIDLSEKGKQPMFNEDKNLALVLNGEIYNYKELKKELEEKGHEFYSKSDSEVVLHLFEEKGEECVKELDGIFAFAIYDIKNKSLFLARDHLGVKPLYYFQDSEKLIFSSEIKAILKHDVKKEINQDSFSSYFHLLYPLVPKTIYKNIFKIPPAHCLTYKNKNLKIERYWRSSFSEKVYRKKEIKKQLKKLTENAVKKQMISDRPLGVFLSGGVDSTVVASIAQKQSAEKLKTFSVGFDIKEEESKFNFDFEMARRVSKDLDTDHHELMISAKDVLKTLEKVAWHMDEPISNHTQPITYLLAEFAKKEVVVVLGGDGGDEIFAGYPRYKYNLLLDWYQKFPQIFRKKFLNKAIETIRKKGELSKKLSTPKGIERYFIFMSQKDEFLKKVVRPKYLNNKNYIKKLEDLYPNAQEVDSNELMMLMDLENWLPEESLMRSDKMTMAHGLEERVPLLDKDLVEFALKIPTRYKINFKYTKKIFKESMGEYLPSYVANAPKRGWFSPMAKWLRGDLKDFAYEVLSEGYCPETKEFFDFKALEKVLDEHISKEKYNLTLVWSIMSFQMWYKNYMC